MSLQVFKRADHLSQHLRGFHGPEYPCPVPGCSSQPMQLKSLLRHFSLKNHSRFIDVEAVFSRCGSCGSHWDSDCACEWEMNVDDILDDEVLFDHIIKDNIRNTRFV